MLPDSDLHAQALARLSACQYTVSTVFQELRDPCDTERRADLLIAIEDLFTEVLQLNNAVNEMTWSSLDKKAHPSSTE
jgi:hypothetical protein